MLPSANRPNPSRWSPKAAARRFYNQLYPQLQLLFPNDLDLVETFLRDVRSSSSGAAAEADNGADGGDAPAPPDAILENSR